MTFVVIYLHSFLHILKLNLSGFSMNTYKYMVNNLEYLLKYFCNNI